MPDHLLVRYFIGGYFLTCRQATAAYTTSMNETPPPGINTFNEKPLHAALKHWYAQPGARFEVPLDGYIIDLVQGDLLIEIQTGSFASLKAKLHTLVERHPVRLVYPIAAEKWIVKLPQEPGGKSIRRKSPKRGCVVELCAELVSFPRLLAHPNFTLEVLLTQEEEVRRFDARQAWRRRGWVIEERRLLDVVARHRFDTPDALAALLPADLPTPFTTTDLAAALGQSRWLAQKMAYCLRETGGIEATGKRGRAVLYAPACSILKEIERGSQTSGVKTPVTSDV